MENNINNLVQEYKANQKIIDMYRKIITDLNKQLNHSNMLYENYKYAVQKIATSKDLLHEFEIKDLVLGALSFEDAIRDSK